MPYTAPRHYDKPSADWLTRALPKLVGQSLPYWCSPAKDALIVAVVPYEGAYDRGPHGFAASVTLHCYLEAWEQVRTVPTVLEAWQVARLTGEPLPPDSRWR